VEIEVEAITIPTIYEGKPAAQVIIRDVTDRRRAEESLHREDEQLRLLVQASGAMLGSLDLEQVLSQILNLAKHHIAADAYAVWRYQPSTGSWQAIASDGLLEAYRVAAIGAMNHATAMPDRPLVVENLDQEPLLAGHRETHRLQGTQALLVVPLPIHNAIAGTLAFYYHQPHRFTDSETRVAEALANLSGAAIGTTELYQEQARLRADAEAAVRVRDQFLALVSHDLKNPLTVMKGRTQLLQRQLSRSDHLNRVQIEDGLAQIVAGVEHMLGVLNDLVGVARAQTGQTVELNCQPMDLVALANHIARGFQQLTEHHKILVESNVAELIGCWDASRLERVLENLLANAVKYSPRGGPITVRVNRVVNRDSGRALLIVRDQGIGIPPEDLPYVFEPFRRGHNVDGQVEGVGIGLAGVRQMIEQHGGTIEVASDVDRGSTFTIRLPLQPAEAATELPPTTSD
jgi:signal transduction histidine kinase